ncbi:MAG: hypothetical protein EPO07_08925 [Verrucomicrobia bacterium]|nr:MAG: hypothetical protein EPO07_08925 [Verrucomicrobiota bacterium]
MLRFIQRLILALALIGGATKASAFSMIGPFAVDDTGAVWQVQRIGYLTILGDIGGPMNLGEEYRWNIPTIIYGYDESFLNYFGQQGVNEIEKAIAILNAVPAASKMSADLREFPTDTRRFNQRASALGLLDLKTQALGLLVEELGLASPERFVWTLRNRDVRGGITFYDVIKRNFDPVTLAPSSYVNDTLYTYTIFDPILPGPFADAVEIPVDPLASTYTAVASSAGLWGGFANYGEFYTGLTRDDMGGLRYLYRKNNYNIENLLPDAIASGGAWSPIVVGVTNVIGTNTPLLRPGVEKLVFKRGKYDSLLGSFITQQVNYKQDYIVNNRRLTLGSSRILNVPDVIFGAADIAAVLGSPRGRRTDTGGWADNDAINGQFTLSGPGVIQPQIAIEFNKVGPLYQGNDSAAVFLTEPGGILFYIWGSFDGTTNAPVVYPIGTSIEELEAQVLNPSN